MSVLDTLEICFTANLSGVNAQLSALKGAMAGLPGSGKVYGRALSDGLAAGIRSGQSGVNAAVSSIVNAATKKIRSLLSIHSPSKVTEKLGTYFGEGFAAGIGGSDGDVGAAAGGIAHAATKRIRSLLNIHSPSKVTEGLGAYFGEGFAAGIGGSVRAVEHAAGALANGAEAKLQSAALPESASAGGVESAVQAAVERALGGVELTIPLNVDGMKLGEASIRGINAVTRSAGRVLLNI